MKVYVSDEWPDASQQVAARKLGEFIGDIVNQAISMLLEKTKHEEVIDFTTGRERIAYLQMLNKLRFSSLEELRKQSDYALGQVMDITDEEGFADLMVKIEGHYLSNKEFPKHLSAHKGFTEAVATYEATLDVRILCQHFIDSDIPREDTRMLHPMLEAHLARQGLMEIFTRSRIIYNSTKYKPGTETIQITPSFAHTKNQTGAVLLLAPPGTH